MKISPRIALFLFVALSVTTITTHAIAQSPSPEVEATITENLKNRLKETINSVEVVPTPDTVGYVGRIRDIVKNTLVVEDKSGKKNILVNDETTIVRSPGSAEIKLESVKIGDAIIAIGSPGTGGTETIGKRIIVSDTPFEPPAKLSGIGKITKLSTKLVEITDGTGTATTIMLSDKTVVKSPKELIELTDMNENDMVIYSALVDTKDVTKLTATILMQIKQSEPSIEESPSPKPTRSPRPSPSPAPEL